MTTLNSTLNSTNNSSINSSINSTINTVLCTNVSATVSATTNQAGLVTKPVLKQIKMRSINHLLANMGKALALSSMVRTK
jgi:spore coat protein CotF